MNLFDDTSGLVPTTLSVNAHPLQRQVFDALFANGGALNQYGGQTQLVCQFYEKATEIAKNITWLVKNAIAEWKFDIEGVRTARSSTYCVNTTKFPDARFLSWNPFQKLHRVVYVGSGESADSFRDEILRDYRDVVARPDGVSEETKERFKTAFYKEHLLPRLSELRDSMVDNDESRAKETPTTDRHRLKHCDERRAYPVLGPLDYHFYLENTATISIVASCFNASTFQQTVDPLPKSVVDACLTLQGSAGGSCAARGGGGGGGGGAGGGGWGGAWGATCALYSECFLTMIKPSGEFMIDDMEMRNGLFVLSAAQSNTKKDEESANNEDLWLIKVIHHMLKIYDGRLNDRNFVNVTEPQQVQRDKRHANGGLSHKMADMEARIQANLVAVVTEKIFAYMRIRFDTFKSSNKLDGEWLEVAKIEHPNTRREKLLHMVNLHKGDVQGAVAAYHSRPTRKGAAAGAEASSSSSSMGTMVVSDAAELHSVEPSIGSSTERSNLHVDCAVIEAVIHHRVAKPREAGAALCYAGGVSTAIVASDGDGHATTTPFNRALVVAGVDVCNNDDDDADDTQAAQNMFAHACEVVGWLSFSRRLSIEELTLKCEKMVDRVRSAGAFCKGIVAILKHVKPLYEEEHNKITTRDRTARDVAETALGIQTLADMQCSGSTLVQHAFLQACLSATEDVFSPAGGMKANVVYKMLDGPSRWTSLSAELDADLCNMEEAEELITKYKNQALACDEPTFFDFTDRLEQYIGPLVAQRLAVIEEGSRSEPIALLEHSPKKSEFNFVKARVDAFEKQRNAWNTAVLGSLSRSLQLCGSWVGLDCPSASSASRNMTTHVAPAVSSIMQMLTICECSNSLLITNDPDKFDAFCAGTATEASTNLMAVLTTPQCRCVAFTPFREDREEFGLTAFAARSPENWTIICCIAITAFRAMQFSRNKPFDSTFVAIQRHECTVLLYDDDEFVHIHGEHRVAARTKMNDLMTQVRTSYPSKYAWKFSDRDLATAQHIKVLCMVTPSILNQETGFVNFSGVKDRPDVKNGVFKIAPEKFMDTVKKPMCFNVVFYDDRFGTAERAGTPGRRVEVECESQGFDVVHTPVSCVAAASEEHLCKRARMS